MTHQSLPPMATSDEVAAILRMTQRSAERLMRNGGVPGAKRIGKRWLVPRSSLVALAGGVQP